MRGRGKWYFGQNLLIWCKSTQVLQYLCFFGTIKGFANHSEWKISLMNPAANNLAISCPMAFLFSEENRRRESFTGLAFGSTCNLCLANSLGTPGMSAGFHAKMSKFSRRKLTSSSSYWGSISVAVLVYLSSSVGCICTLLVSPADSNEDVFFGCSNSDESATFLYSASSTSAICWSAIRDPFCNSSSVCL